MKLFDEEVILLGNNDNTVTLTTHRIRSDFGNGSEASLTSMMLENVSCIQLDSARHPILLLIGGILFIGGFGMSLYGNGHSGAIVALPIFGGLVIAALYFYTRKHTCIIVSDGGCKMVFSTVNMKRGALVDFIDRVEEAKFHRMEAGNSVARK